MRKDGINACLQSLLRVVMVFLFVYLITVIIILEQ